MPKTKVEVYDKDQLIYPYIESDHVTFSNGMKVSEMLDQGISMPTVTHEDLSFKVGVGDQDVSSAIVDSSVSEMTIKGKTYQNILPEPSTHVLTNNKEMFKVNEGLNPNVEIVVGVSKSAILKGNTLVNLWGTKREHFFTNGTFENSVLTSNSWCCLHRVEFFKPNTEYTLITNIISISDTNTYFKANNVASNGIFKTETNKLNKVGIYVEKVISYDDFTGRQYSARSLVSGGGTIQFNMVVLEGDYTNVDIPYFEGMQSVKMPVLTTTGKNLLNFEKTQNGYLGANPHSLNAPDQNNKTSDYIRVKPNTTYTYSFDGFTAGQVGGEYWTGWYYYTSPTEVSKKNMNRQVVKGSADTFKIVTFTTPSDCYYVRIGSRGLMLNGATAQLEENTTATSYEPYKTNILTVNEPIELHGIDDIKDTLDLATGELIQRIDKVVLDGGEDKVLKKGFWDKENTVAFYLTFDETATQSGRLKFLCSELKFNNNFYDVDEECILYTANVDGTVEMYIRLLRSRLENVSVEGLKSYLSKNPIIVFRQRIKPVIKTVDLSSSGNWEKVVLDGSEEWRADGDHYCFCLNLQINSICAFTDSIPVLPTKTNSLPSHASFSGARYFTVLIDGILNDPVKLKQYLSQNPITVWYQIQSHQDSTQVKQPIFFKDGHIQLLSEADNSLIPTLDYQAKTSNSYVMDLMKANTRYTMKAKSASGTFTIDGTSYGAGTNGTFTTPSSMANKFLVMSNKTNEEVMILEGDVVSKTIPYFKGIKSTFEGEDKIEVLSTGKNLFDGAFEKGVIDVNGNLGYTTTAIRTINYISVKPNTSYHINLLNLESFESIRVVYVHEYDENLKVLGETQVNNRDIYTSKSATKFIKINTHNAHDLPVDSKMIVCENSTIDKQYEPYKSNSTKIPLLSPLRSLPNGVRDEVIIDRENHKAKIIQRVGCVMLDGSEEWGAYPTMEQDKTLLFQSKADCKQGKSAHCVSDRFPYSGSLWNSGFDDEGVMMGGGGSTYKRVDLRISKIKVSSTSPTILREYLSKNPFVVLYELETPIITEVDLEGFPYIYKDGHIFLDSDIAPTTEITYSINQSQQISASNEDIIRHEKELTYLQKLIAQYVQVDYESVLLSLKV